MKHSVIISTTHGLYEQPHKLRNKLSRKSQNFIELKPSSQSYSQNENSVNTSKKL